MDTDNKFRRGKCVAAELVMLKKVNKSSKAVGHECNRITETPSSVQLNDSCKKNAIT